MGVFITDEEKGYLASNYSFIYKNFPRILSFHTKKINLSLAKKMCISGGGAASGVE